MQLSERERECASEGGRLKGLHYSALRKEIRERRSLGASAARSNSSVRSLLGYCCPRVCVRAGKWGLVSVYDDIFREYTKDTHMRIREYAKNEIRLTFLDVFCSVSRAGNLNWRKYTGNE